MLPEHSSAQEAQEAKEARKAWEAVLDRLEDAVESAARALEDPLAAPVVELWSPPQEPLPEELRGRAERLIEAQKLLLVRMDRRRREAGRQMTAVRRVPAASAAGQSLYLDVSG